jgi:hypothetical protein
MKLKATATRTLPRQILEALDSPEVVERFRNDVVLKHLHVSPQAFGPATHYVQATDLTIELEPGWFGIEASLTKVSANRLRSASDFENALRAVEKIYLDLIERLAPPGGIRIQLFCVLQLDKAVEGPDGKDTCLIETEPRWVEPRGS